MHGYSPHGSLRNFCNLLSRLNPVSGLYNRFRRCANVHADRNLHPFRHSLLQCIYLQVIPGQHTHPGCNSSCRNLPSIPVFIRRPRIFFPGITNARFSQRPFNDLIHPFWLKSHRTGKIFADTAFTAKGCILDIPVIKNLRHIPGHRQFPHDQIRFQRMSKQMSRTHIRTITALNTGRPGPVKHMLQGNPVLRAMAQSSGSTRIPEVVFVTTAFFASSIVIRVPIIGPPDTIKYPDFFLRPRRGRYSLQRKSPPAHESPRVPGPLRSQ